MGRCLIRRRAPHPFFPPGNFQIRDWLVEVESRFFPEADRRHGVLMLTQFYLDGQHYSRIGEETRPTDSGRAVRVTLWQSHCPDCGAAFVQHHRARGFDPAKRAHRRCPSCRNGPGKRVRGSRNGMPHFSSSPPAPILPARWRAPALKRHALRVPHTSARPDAIASTPWAVQQSTPPRSGPFSSAPQPDWRTARAPRVFVDK